MSQKNNQILPNGYYRITSKGAIEENGALYSIKLLQGPFRGVKFTLADKIKIREDVESGNPQLIYDWKVIDFAGYGSDIDSSIILSRIIGAIAVELLSGEIENGAKIESV